MGRKESWFSAIKRAFTPHSKPDSESQPRKEKKKKKKGFGRLRRGEKNSLLPIFREPSSIEKILGEVERDHNLVFRPISPVVVSPQPVSPPVVSSQPVYTQPVSPKPVSPRTVSPRPASPRQASSSSNYPRAASPATGSQRVVSPKANSLQPVSPRHVSQLPVSPGSVSSRLDYPKPVSPKPISQLPLSPGSVSSRHDYPKPVSPRPVSHRVVSPIANSPGSTSQRAHRPRALSPRFVQRPKEISCRPEPTTADQHASATKIQAAFRGYTVRGNFRAGKGMVRLQEVMKGKNAKRQTKNALKHMQLVVRVQTQIQSRRIQMLQNQHSEKETILGRSGTSEDRNGNWDGSVLTKEEKDARLQRKADATIMRERSMAYAYHPRLRSSSCSGTSPLWLHWVDRQLPMANTPPRQPQQHLLTPPRENPSRFDNNSETSTPNSPIPRAIRTPPSYTRMSRFSGARTDDSDSLMSCPPSISRHYMTPTASARAKARTNSHPRERAVAADGSKRRLSYPLVKGRNTGSSGLGSPCGSVRSLGDLSVVSTASTTAARKPFNRFV